MILIHTALLCEAQSFIEYYKLKKINSSPKIYANDDILICISGIGKLNTLNALEYIYVNYEITKAFNIGIAGCNDTSIDIGMLFCTNQSFAEIKTLPLITSDTVVTDSNIKKTTLYDMEAKYFHHVSQQYIKEEDILIIKIVSDHLSSEILQKDVIKNMISKQKNLHSLIKRI